MRFRSIFKHYWKFIRRYPWQHIGILFTWGSGNIATIVVAPLIYKHIIDTVSDPGPDAFTTLNMMIVALVVQQIYINIIFRWGDYLVTYVQSNILKELMDYSLERLQQHSYTFFTNSFSGSLIAKAKRFVNAFETLHDQFIFSFWMGSVALVSSIIVLFFNNALLGVIYTIWLILYIVIVRILVAYQIPKSLANAEADSKVTGHFSDIISNFFTVKMFGTREREERDFSKTTNVQREKRFTAWMQEGFWGNLYQGLAVAFFNVGLIWAAIELWKDGAITAGTIVVVQVYILTTFNVVWNISKNFIRVTTALTDADEMVAIFDQEIGVPDPQEPEKVQMPNGDIRFDKVHFTYEGNTKVFANLDLHIPAGQKVALVGHSGAGKTTITKLLLRFRDIQSGTITIDGQDITKVRQDELRKQIAYVPQEPVLFHRSLKENISYGKPNAKMDEIVAVAKKAHAHEFIEKLPKGYNTLVGERGVKLSGGERQRVAIARAMLKDAPIIMLDEATSSLDSVSEQLIQDALWKLIEGKTTIIIAHRLSTIQSMDRIIVFDNGRIKEEGTHHELLKTGGIYAELWNSQVGGFIGD